MTLIDPLPYIDPFGAPEFLVTSVAYREFIGTELIRLGWCTTEGSACVLRFKAVIPITQIEYEHEMTRSFLAGRTGKDGRK